MPTQSNAKEALHEIVCRLIGDGTYPAASGVEITGQLRPEEGTPFSTPRDINAAFLISLSGRKHPAYTEAVEYLDEMERDPLWSAQVSFYRKAIGLLEKEFQEFCSSPEIVATVERLVASLGEPGGKGRDQGVQKDIWALFHPETVGIIEDKEALAEELRQRRLVKITSLNTEPVRDVSKEVLFTSNVLLTIPPAGKCYEELDISPNLLGALEETTREEQVFWYDHPVQIGVEPERNEILYGLRHLSEALEYEKKAGNAEKDSELCCVLSASVTHEGLQGIVKEYVEYELDKVHDLSGLKVYLFTEADTVRLIHEVLAPAAKRYVDDAKNPAAALREVVGVDGKYGRHYSFLKAIAAFWQVFIDPQIKATFKTDLDQVFPQNELVKETGKTAFEHLMTPLWGADGVDSNGRAVHLGMIAGALVNEKDIHSSVFTPDVKYPSPPFMDENTIFCSRIPQALSTVSEMMTRYTDGDRCIDGIDNCITRIHVTGGTNGITVEALRKYRPFTPVFINRAEDQAYLLSVLFSEDADSFLRYVHKDGLFMRHDKEAFAGEAIKAAAVGKHVGDYERILYFSSYAQALPWGVEEIKEAIDPFTGSFVSRLPLTISVLRLALKGAALFSTGKEVDGLRGMELLETGSKRLQAAVEELAVEDGLKESYEREKAAWELYYDILERFSEALKKEDPHALELKKKAEVLVKEARVITGTI